MKALALILCFIVIPSKCHIAEILFDEEDLSPGNNAANNANHMPSSFMRNGGSSEEGSGNICHIEFQVLKRATGHCMKLGKGSAKGCVSGTYIHPFHPECL
jgi:hypothetical protein